MTNIEKIVIVTQKTWLDELVEKFSTKQQAKFYIEHSGGDFQRYEIQHRKYYTGLRQLKQQLPKSIRTQVIEKSFLPSFLFNDDDLIIVFGRDGLVINTAKYLDGQFVMGVNPNPDQVEGILLPFSINQVSPVISAVLDDTAPSTLITLAQAELNNGQHIIGVNDLFVGHQSHQSARYTIKYGDSREQHSSSGIIISTGVGSTGWYKSVVTGAMQMASYLGMSGRSQQSYRFDWSAKYLKFCVREAWKSKTTGNSLIFGTIRQKEKLVIESHMSEGGVIFSDGMERDRISFNSGRIAEISVSPKNVHLLI